MKGLVGWVPTALMLLVAMGMAGCGVGSIAPVIADSEARYDAKLVGTWADSSNKESFVVSEASPNRYAILYTDSDGKIGRFQGVLGQVGSLRVLDVEPEDLPKDMSDTYKSLLLPLHGAVFIDAVDPELRFRILQADSLKRYLEQRPRTISHMMRDEAVVFTAPTKDLQRFLVDYVRRPGALQAPTVMTRRSP